MKHGLAFLAVASIASIVGCSSQIEPSESGQDVPTEGPATDTPSDSVRAPEEMQTMNLTQGAADGDWCGNRRVSDSAYLRNRSIGAFKCAANALCGRLGPNAAMACSIGLTSLLEGAKDDPDVNNILMSLIGAALLQIDSQMTFLTLIAQNKEMYEQLVKKVGVAKADQMFKNVITLASDPRLKPSLSQVPKTTWAGLLLSCAEAIRGACDLVVNTVYAAQEGWEAWVDPDWKGSVPGCQKSTAVAVTNYTYVFWNSAQATLRSCVDSCRAEADSCGGNKRNACLWWNACVNYCAATKTGSVTAGSSYRMVCAPAPKADPVAIANAYLQCLARAPSDAEVRQWVNVQLQGTDAVSAICNSTEARQRIVAGAYVGCLGREGSAAEIQGWVSGTVGTGALRDAICASDEAKRREATLQTPADPPAPTVDAGAPVVTPPVEPLPVVTPPVTVDAGAPVVTPPVMPPMTVDAGAPVITPSTDVPATLDMRP
ncbi:MAG: hypothetical protein U0169_26815 [Polyangiaceae bacterium]